MSSAAGATNDYADLEDADRLLQRYGSDLFAEALDLVERHDDIGLRQTSDGRRFSYEFPSARGRWVAPISGTVRFIDRGRGIEFEVRCSCSSYNGCAHGLAAVLATFSRAKPSLRAQWRAALGQFEALPQDVRQWLRQLPGPQPARKGVPVAPAMPPASREYNLVFVIGEGTAGRPLGRISTLRAKWYKNGPGYLKNAPSFAEWNALLRKPTGRDGRHSHDADDLDPADVWVGWQPSSPSWDSDGLSWVTDEQRALAKQLFMADALPDGATLMVAKLDAATILPLLVSTGELYYSSHLSVPLKLGESRPLTLAWSRVGDLWRPTATIEPKALLLGTDAPWYCDPVLGTVGPLDTALTGSMLSMVVSAPPMPTKALATFNNALARTPHLAAHLPPAPQLKIVDLGIAKPLPILHIENHPFANEPRFRLTFDYDDGHVVTVIKPGTFEKQVGDELRVRHRDVRRESACRQRLLDAGGFVEDGSENLAFVSATDDPYRHSLDFQQYLVPELNAEGWVVLLAPDFEWRIARPETPDWELQLDPAEPGWFELSMGIIVGGQRVDLIGPVLALLRDRATRESIRDLDVVETSELFAKLPTGEYLPISVKRLREIAGLLLDLEDNDAGQKPRVSRFDLGWLHLVEQTENLHLSGHDQLRTLAAQLANAPKDVPADFVDHPNKPLWRGQRESIAWLQAVKAVGMGGLLADGMGAGKTRITLSHLLIEKRSGRAAGYTSLGVMPKTAFAKWYEERDKFTPDVRILTLHGTARGGLYDEIAAHDLVLMTYDTVTADLDKLMALPWDVVFLEEGHRIGNARTDRSRALYQLPARQRFVISGTPMQNRAEEYWSLFNFAVPGLLRSLSWFRTRFASKRPDLQSESERMVLLGKLTAPFVRRTPEGHGREDLPPLTVKTEYIELAGRQRDLYETVRLRTDKDVRAKIAALGLGRAQIAILAAITQLRQVCCDPSLLEIEAAKGIESAKLKALDEMVETLLAEGRRPIIFSQWTTMINRIGAMLDSKGITYTTYTGDHSLKQRKTNETLFRSGKVQTMVLGLKVGGEIIDLPEANVVILYDPWWNPLAEQQAIKRAHREGQVNPVLAIRMIVQGSVEEGIVAMGKRKEGLAEAIFEGTTKGLERMTMEDIDMLFKPLESE